MAARFLRPAVTMKRFRLFLLLLCPVVSFAGIDLSRYPLAEELVLGTVTAEVLPARQLRLKAPATGYLHLTLPPPGTRITKDTVWAELDPARLDLERRALKLARALLTAKEEPALRLEQARNQADLIERLDEIERQAAMLRKLLKEPDLGELYLSDATDAAAKARAMLAQLDRQAGLVRDVLAYVGTSRQEELELQALHLKLEQQEIELTRRERDSRLVMPFDGELTLIPPAPPAGEPLFVESGLDLARLQDFAQLHARTVMRRTEWRLVDPARVTLRIPTGGGELRARYTRRLTEEVFGREELVYHFAFAPDQAVAARPLVGGQISAQLVAALPQPARLVPKLDLLLLDPESFRTLGWEQAVARLIPGATVVLQGETHVAIVTP